MQRSNHTTTLLGAMVLFSGFLILAAPFRVHGQVRPSPTPPDSKPLTTDKDDLSSDIGSHESEMRARLALKAEKKQYEENLDRAREAAQIASELRDAYQAKESFSPEDHKKLERMEKLTRRIRNEAGGSDSDVKVEVPPLMKAAVKRVAEVADELRKEVEKTPRHVISAAVIDQATKLLGLIKHLRDLNQ